MKVAKASEASYAGECCRRQDMGKRENYLFSRYFNKKKWTLINIIGVHFYLIYREFTYNIKSFMFSFAQWYSGIE